MIGCPDKLVGKKVKIYHNNFRYEGILIYEDNVIYILDDKIDGHTQIPKANSVMKEIKNEKDSHV